MSSLCFLPSHFAVRAQLVESLHVLRYIIVCVRKLQHSCLSDQFPLLPVLHQSLHPPLCEHSVFNRNEGMAASISPACLGDLVLKIQVREALISNLSLLSLLLPIFVFCPLFPPINRQELCLSSRQKQLSLSQGLNDSLTSRILILTVTLLLSDTLAHAHTLCDFTWVHLIELYVH